MREISLIKIISFFRIFGDNGRVGVQNLKLQHLYLDFYHMGRCRMVIPFPKIGHNRDSEQY